MAHNGTLNGQPHTISGAFREARADWLTHVDNRYRFAKRDRFTRRSLSGSDGSGEDHAVDGESEYFYMVERARELDRDDQIAGVVVNRFCNAILQTGFLLKPQTSSQEVNQYLAMRWSDWVDSPAECDEQGERTFDQLSWHALRDVVVAGDILAAMTDRGTLQLLENHRLRTPRGLTGQQQQMTIFGVELSGARKRQAYWITDDDIPIDQPLFVSNARRVPAVSDTGYRNILHLYHPKRITQTRGITKFCTVGNTCAMLDDVQFAKLVQQQMVSSNAYFRKRPLGFELDDDTIEADSFEVDPYTTGRMIAMKKVHAGMIYTGYPGEELEVLSANVPNPTYLDHAKQLMQLITINFDVPIIMLLLDATETNFSGYRGAMEQAKVSYRMFQRWWAGDFHDPTYNWKLRQWTDPRPGAPLADPFLLDAVAAGVDVFSHNWVYPSWVSTEPLKDTQERLLRYSNNFCSLSRLYAEQDLDFDVEMPRLIDDRARVLEAAIERAIAINQRFPDNPIPINWMHLATHATPTGVSVSIPFEQESEPASDDGQEQGNRP